MSYSLHLCYFLHIALQSLIIDVHNLVILIVQPYILCLHLLSFHQPFLYFIFMKIIKTGYLIVQVHLPMFFLMGLSISHLPKQLANCFGYLILSGEKYLRACRRWVHACPEYLKVIFLLFWVFLLQKFPIQLAVIFLEWNFQEPTFN